MGIGSFFSQLFRSSKNRQENFASFKGSFDDQNLNTNGSGGYKHLIKWDEAGEHQQSLNRSNGTESDRFKAVREAYNACGKREDGETASTDTDSIDLSTATNSQLNDLILKCGHYLFDRSGHRWTFQGQKRKDWVSFVDRIARQQRYSNHVTACEALLRVESFANSFDGQTILDKINNPEADRTKGASKGTVGATTPVATNVPKGKKSSTKSSTNDSSATDRSQEKSSEQILLKEIQNQAQMAYIGLSSAPWAKEYQKAANKVVAEVETILRGGRNQCGKYESDKFGYLVTCLKEFRTVANDSGWTTGNLDQYSKIDPNVIKTGSYIQNPKNHGDGSDKGRGSGIAGMAGGGGGGGVGTTPQKFKNMNQAYKYIQGKS